MCMTRRPGQWNRCWEAYVSDLGNRCIWSVDADARELTAGGKNCGSFVSGLPGYPGALALDEDGTLYISYRWTRSGWLEKHADSTLLRGIALRAGLHCAPLAHRTAGTLDTGTLRLSASFFNTPDQADRLVWAVSRVLRENVEL